MARRRRVLHDRPTSSPIPGLRRLFWLVLLVLHAVAIRSAWSGSWAEGPGAEIAWPALRLLALILSSLFFTLKIADVAWLRLKPGWRPLVASLVVIGFLHVHAISRGAEGELAYSPAHLSVVLIVGTVFESKTVRRGFVRLAAFFRSPAETWASTRCSPAAFHRWMTPDALRPAGALIAAGILTPRPPPSF